MINVKLNIYKYNLVKM